MDSMFFAGESREKPGYHNDTRLVLKPPGPNANVFVWRKMPILELEAISAWISRSLMRGTLEELSKLCRASWGSGGAFQTCYHLDTFF